MLPLTLNNQNVQITSANLNNFSIFRLVTDTTAPEHRVKMKIDNCTYTVQLNLRTGTVSAEREFHLLYSLINKNRATDLKTRLQEQMPQIQKGFQANIQKIETARQIIQEKEKQEKKYWKDLNHAAENNNLTAMQNHFKGQNAPDQKIALYGFESFHQGTMTARYNAVLAADTYNANNPQHTLQTVKIDKYNSAFGIISPTLDTLPLLLESIRSGTLPLLAEHVGLSPEDKEAWKKCLKDNIDRIDIFSRITKFLTEGAKPTTEKSKLSGWEHEVRTVGPQKAMEAYIRKNLPAEIHREGFKVEHITRTAAGLIALATTLQQTDPKKIDRSFLQEFGIAMFGSLDNVCYKVCNAVIQMAFFRETSKLGLEFFRDQQVPVSFQCYTYKGESIIAKPDPAQENPTDAIQWKSEITDKWWHDPEVSADLSLYQPVTYSEMRHLSRLQEKGLAPRIIAVTVEQ